MNGTTVLPYAIPNIVAVPAAEAKLAALFLNTKETRIIRLVLTKVGYPLPATRIHIENATAVGIVNSIIKRQQYHSIEMRYF